MQMKRMEPNVREFGYNKIKEQGLPHMNPQHQQISQNPHNQQFLTHNKNLHQPPKLREIEDDVGDEDFFPK